MKTFNLSSTQDNGISAVICDIGARLLELNVPQENGSFVDLITGPSTESEIVNDQCFMGASVGRFGNRVSDGTYQFNGKTHQLTINDGVNHLHGGEGLHQRTWELVEQSEHSVTLSIKSDAGEDGYPGNVCIQAKYTISEVDTLQVEYSATTDESTPINIVQHAYWNLTGDPKQSIENHVLQSENLSAYLEINETMIPTGKVANASNTPFDFSAAKSLRDGLASQHTQLELAGGYDHCLVFSEEINSSVSNSLTLTDPLSNRSLTIKTNMPAVQLYSGNFLDGSQSGKQSTINYRTGLCIETQHYPDAMNHSHFPSAILNPDEIYQHTIEYIFQ